ncbi:microphthalmia-associated transcription factor-like isoform X4 [Vespula maculifrons]|uniref:Microphthalmia-associated transcription factor-like isoform X4 n=1 Tax=Vespula maculifrons TaxID=7453 RepID=A0ABD2BQN2_VESMC
MFVNFHEILFPLDASCIVEISTINYIALRLLPCKLANSRRVYWISSVFVRHVCNMMKMKEKGKQIERKTLRAAFNIQNLVILSNLMIDEKRNNILNDGLTGTFLHYVGISRKSIAAMDESGIDMGFDLAALTDINTNDQHGFGDDDFEQALSLLSTTTKDFMYYELKSRAPDTGRNSHSTSA